MKYNKNYNFIEYSYNFNTSKLWIPIKYVEYYSNNNNLKKSSYQDENGKQLANAFFYDNKLESDLVQSKLSDILSTIHNSNKILDINHLRNQDFVASYLLKYIIQNNICNIEHICKLLDYLIDISMYLSNKIGVPVVQLGTKKINMTHYITRSSYKFCEFTNSCQYNYPIKHKFCKGCFADHFVHNKIYKDSNSLKIFIKHLVTKNASGTEPIIIRSNKEIVKCINTIHVVIQHMYDELWILYLTHKDKYEEYHRNIVSQHRKKNC